MSAIKKGDIAEGVRQHRGALKIRAGLLAPTHADVLASTYALGAALKMSKGPGKAEAEAEAEKLLRTALEGYRATAGPAAGLTLQTGTQLGTLYRGAGRFPEAAKLYSELVASAKSGLGPEHPKTLQFTSSYGAVLDSCGRDAEAEAALKAAVEGQKKALGPSHEATISTQGTLALLLRKRKRDGEAEELFRDALAKSRQALGDEHRITLAVINNLGVLLREQKRLDETEKLYREALATKRRVFGEVSATTLNTLGNLANLLQEMGQYEESETLLAQEVNTRKQNFGTGNRDTLTAMRNLGSVMNLRNKSEEGERILREAHTASVKALGEDHTTSVDIARAHVKALEAIGNTSDAASLKSTLPQTVEQEGTGGIESAFEMLGSIKAFQSVFGRGLARTDDALARAFSDVNTDGSGKISRAELEEYIVRTHGRALDKKMMDEIIKAVDMDGDGEIDLDEFKRVFAAREATRAAKKR